MSARLSRICTSYPATTAATTALPSAPAISAAASAAGTMGALGWIEPLAWVSSKSSEWPRLPLNRAAAGGEYEAASPMTLAPAAVSAPPMLPVAAPPMLPAARPRWRSAAAIEALSPASLRPRIEMPTWSISSILARSTTSGGSVA